MNEDHKFQNKYRITSARLQKYDYGQNGAYFVTIGTKNREHFFGKIAGREMIYSKLGHMVCNYLLEIPRHFPFIKLGPWVVMPNHVHGIFIFNKSDGNDYDRHCCNRRDAKFCVSTTTTNHKNGNKFGPQSQNLASVIRGFKIGVTKYARQNTDIYEVWQSRFHDRIIRDENELTRISEYIISNPQHWKNDYFY
jgi:putative transposase